MSIEYVVSTPLRNEWRVPGTALAVYALIWLALAVAPVSREDWLLENLLVFIFVPALIATRRRMRFANLSYICILIFFSLHAVGAHYTYSLVPYDRWFAALVGSPLSDLLHWQRNHYDRFVHFLYGALMLPPAVELLGRYAPSQGAWRRIIPTLFIMSHSVIYEVVEWVAAIIVAPDLGAAYLGTQGDQWDAQKDMALAAAGAVLSMLVLRIARPSFGRAR